MLLTQIFNKFLILTLFVQVGSLPNQSPEASQAQDDEIHRQYVRFQTLVHKGKLTEAEATLALIESYKGSPQLGREYAQLALWRNDYGAALPLLRSFFDGKNEGDKTVYGAEDTRIWYWFLVAQRGNEKKAEQIMGDLFRDTVHMPYSVKYINPRELSDVKLAQVYMYMAANCSARANYIRSNKYIALAKIADPKVKVDPKFYEGAKLYQQATLEKYEAEENFPMLDHVLFRKKVGKPVRIF